MTTSVPPAPPSPSKLTHLKATDAAGLAFAGSALALSAGGIWLSSRDAIWWWTAGQIVFSIALLQWFVLLHECGHQTLFRTRSLNRVAGSVAGFFALIPFEVWTHVHRQHHRWTGWQDLDPTTSTLVPRPRTALERGIVDLCWRLWIPLFSVVYRVGNFWNPWRLVRVEESRRRTRLIASAVGSLAIYAAIGWWLGSSLVLRLTGLAVVASFVFEDMLLISQHTHVPMELSQGERVVPHRALDQERYTRSLRLPSAASRFLVHIDAHELHHMYPFVPGYRLREIPYRVQNEVGWWRWIRSARAVPGDVLLFHNRHDTGFDL
jgi:fatty acid desaturase